MGSINHDIAIDIINGKYDDDKPVKIVSYLNAWGSYTLAVVFAHDNYNKYEQSPACQEVEAVFKGGMLTYLGTGYFEEEIAAGLINAAVIPAGSPTGK